MSNDTTLDSFLDRVDSMEDDRADLVEEFRIADSRDGRFYRHDERTRLALKVALITARPLLLIGPPGCGKSSLAPYVARNLRFKLLSYTVTETSEPSDLLWRIDYVRRLNDAQVPGGLLEMTEYVEHGILWQAFTAKPSPEERGTLILIDEIDKATAGFANSLLVGLGSLQFEVPALKNETIRAQPGTFLLVMMTSNGERELPPALTRRCIVLRVEYPTAEALIDVTRARWPSWMDEPAFSEGVRGLATSLTGGRDPDIRVSTAEFLDLVQVLRKSKIEPGSERWATIEGLVLLRGEDEG